MAEKGKNSIPKIKIKKKKFPVTKKKFNDIREKKSVIFKNTKKIEVSDNFTAKALYNILDDNIVSQEDAKKKIAIAFVDRNRRLKVADEKMKDAIKPKNIIMFGPTGVGKSELARRIAKETNSPFLKVDITKYTEVGYAGRDCESIIKDLVDTSIKRGIKAAKKIAYDKYKDISTNEILNIYAIQSNISLNEAKKLYKNGSLIDMKVSIEIPENYYKNQVKKQDNFLNTLMESGQFSFISFVEPTGIDKKIQKKKEKKELNINDAIEAMIDYEIQQNVDDDQIINNIVEEIQNKGIVFIDEIDKLISRKDSQSRGEVSREGVQRDLLALVEGTIINTKYGPINTEHILFIAAGAFYEVKVSDLMPELQGRFPIRTELKSLTIDDFEKILNHINYSLIKQQKVLLSTDGIELNFTKCGIRKIAEYTYQMNLNQENIGARRLNSVIDYVVSDISFAGQKINVKINDKYVEEKVKHELKSKLKLNKYTI